MPLSLEEEDGQVPRICLLGSSFFLHSAVPLVGAGSQFAKMVFR